MRIGGFLFATAVALASLPLAVQAETRPIVVELFTSQGCSSCPPADALLTELAQRPEVIALGFHIDYWDKLGWKDPLSTPQSTERQRRYARLFGTPTYTPQLVIDGTREMVGSQRETVLAALRQTTPAAVAPVAFATDRRAVTIGTAAAAAGDGQVWLVRRAGRRSVPVRIRAARSTIQTVSKAWRRSASGTAARRHSRSIRPLPARASRFSCRRPTGISWAPRYCSAPKPRTATRR